MKNDIYTIYTKGLEYCIALQKNVLTAAYSIHYQGIPIHSGQTKCDYHFSIRNIFCCDIPEGKGHFIMEIYAAYAGLCRVPKGSKVVIKTNNLSCVNWLNGKEPPEAYLPIWKNYYMALIERNSLNVTCEWVQKGSCTETISVNNDALRKQKE